MTVRIICLLIILELSRLGQFGNAEFSIVASNKSFVPRKKDLLVTTANVL